MILVGTEYYLKFSAILFLACFLLFSGYNFRIVGYTYILCMHNRLLKRKL